MKSYDLGSLVHLRATFTDTVSKLPVDPDVVTLKILDGGGLETIFTLTPDSLGEYSHDVSASKSGHWFYRFEGTGTHQAAAESGFTVNKSKFP